MAFGLYPRPDGLQTLLDVIAVCCGAGWSCCCSAGQFSLCRPHCDLLVIGSLELAHLGDRVSRIVVMKCSILWRPSFLLRSPGFSFGDQSGVPFMALFDPGLEGIQCVEVVADLAVVFG